MLAVADVVVVGAGIAGLAAAKELHGRSLHVTLLDAENYTTFQPLLFEAATAMVAAEDVVTPVHVLVRRWPDVTFRMGRADGIDWDRHRVCLSDGDELAFDFLVLAPGVVSTYHHVVGAERYAIPLKTVSDAIRLATRCYAHSSRRRRILSLRGRRVLSSLEEVPAASKRRGTWLTS